MDPNIKNQLEFSAIIYFGWMEMKQLSVDASGIICHIAADDGSEIKGGLLL